MSKAWNPFYRPQLIEEVENVEKYVKGGFHPVHLEDKFKEGRYRIIHKLGHGGFATVWLARDNIRGRNVALKIFVAEASENDIREAAIIRHLNLDTSLHTGSRHVASILDLFTFEGPNGSHMCMVLPVAGPSLRSMSNSPGQRTGTWRLRADLARKIAMQATQGVSFLHSEGVAHGDLTASNILLRLHDVDTWTLDGIYEQFGHPNMEALKKRPSAPADAFAPAYTIEAPRLNLINPKFFTGDLFIVDFGQSFLVKHPPTKGLGIPASYSAPESLFDMPPSSASDLWALGCLIYEIRAGAPLFSYFFGPPTKDMQLAAFVSTFGKLPETWWNQWEVRDAFFDDNGVALQRSESPWCSVMERMQRIGRADLENPPYEPSEASSEDYDGESEDEEDLEKTNAGRSDLQDSDDGEGETTCGNADQEDNDSVPHNPHVQHRNYDSVVASILSEAGVGSDMKHRSGIIKRSPETSRTADIQPVDPQKELSTHSNCARVSVSTKEPPPTTNRQGEAEQPYWVAKFKTRPVAQLLEPLGTIVSTAEAACLENLLIKLLRYEPEERMAAVDLAFHPWFSGRFTECMDRPWNLSALTNSNPTSETKTSSSDGTTTQLARRNDAATTESRSVPVTFDTSQDTSFEGIGRAPSERRTQVRDPEKEDSSIAGVEEPKTFGRGKVGWCRSVSDPWVESFSLPVLLRRIATFFYRDDWMSMA